MTGEPLLCEEEVTVEAPLTVFGEGGTRAVNRVLPREVATSASTTKEGGEAVPQGEESRRG